MITTIARTTSGAIKLVQDATVTYLINPTSVTITARDGAIIVDYLGKYYYTITLAGLGFINGAPFSGTLAQALVLISETVFTDAP